MVQSVDGAARGQAAADPAGLTRERLICRGAVQGVGFRPAVWRLATALGLTGVVRNDAEGASIEVQGPEQAVRRFRERLESELPPLARLDDVAACALEVRPESGFAVEDSNVAERRRALIPPDAVICADCRRELEDEADRRHRYPFTNCTNCGPRFTLAVRLPYDRERTSMARFPLCADCSAEYTEPSDRRFHAEPVSCPACGPRLFTADARGRLDEGAEALRATRIALAKGKIAAIHGLGGFQLACRADDAAAVARLRERKRRPTKPFALMARDLVEAHRLVALTDDEAALMAGPRGPIVLAPRRPDARIEGEIAPGIDDLGVMLPTTPLHVELFRSAPYRALVMTSGNRGDEPICRTPAEARERLADLADVFLLHEREVVRRADDSVVRAGARGPVLVRRSRGWVPEPLPLPVAAPEPILALGGHLQTTACVAVGMEAFPSQHVGDLDTEPARAFLVEVGEGLEDFLEVRSRALATDEHPDYPSSWIGAELAAARGGAVLRVQHHLAHAAAVLAEHGRFPSPGQTVAALVLDGTGFGPDGTAWGAEVLLIDGDLAWSRPAHAATLPLVGGERAVREPWRVAAAALALADAGELCEDLPIARHVAPGRLRTVQSLATRGDWPRASGAGRLFEAAGALLGLAVENDWEGEAAARLEAHAARAAARLVDVRAERAGARLTGLGPVRAGDQSGAGRPAARGYLPVRSVDIVHEGERLVELRPVRTARDLRGALPAPWPELAGTDHGPTLPSAALLAAVARRHAGGEPADLVAAGFHATFAHLAVRMLVTALPEGVRTVALGGGCLVNRLLAELLCLELEEADLEPLCARAVPPGDGGLSYGQAVVAAIALARGTRPRYHEGA